jgi:hypothetical protein
MVFGIGFGEATRFFRRAPSSRGPKDRDEIVRMLRYKCRISEGRQWITVGVLSVGREWITVCVLSVCRQWITVCVLSVGRQWITVCV